MRLFSIRRSGRAGWLAGLVLLMPVLVQGAPKAPAGYVMTVSGDAFVVHAGSSVPARVGMPFHVHDGVRTGKTGSIGLSLADTSRFSFGPDSLFSLQRFDYEPVRPRLTLVARFERGTLNYVAGAMARLASANVQIQTPNGSIGATGPQLLARIVPPKPKPGQASE